MTNWLKASLSLIFLSIMLLLAYQQTQAPEARTDSDLDYDMLVRHVSFIASKPHPIGSQANREVRDYIVDYFESLGLDTEVQKTTVVYRHPSRPGDNTILGNVENIIARLPGKEGQTKQRDKDLVLMAHYDSRPLTFGAADDASGTASVMEVARLMVAGPVPVHDVVFLITDGEEMGLLGAQGFFRQHPAAAGVGLVLDFESRGSTGASTMFETSEKNDWLVKNLIASAPDLIASSLSYEIYRKMPNDTDMSISKGEGLPGLNFSFFAGLFDYHAMTDTAENLDKNSLAQQANYALATARHFANLDDWQTGSDNLTYFNLWRGTLVKYSRGFALVSGLLVMLFGVWTFVTRRRAGTLLLGPLASGLLGALVLIIIVSNVFASLIDYQHTADVGIARLISLGLLPLLAYFITTLGICLWFSAAIRRGFSKSEVWLPAVILALISVIAGRSLPGAAILMLILIPSMIFLRSCKNVPDLWGGALLVWWLLTGVLLFFAPNASYMFVWPLFFVLLGFFFQRRKNQADGDASCSITLASSLVPLLLLSPFIILAYLALGSNLPQAIMIVTTVCLLLIWPLIQIIGSAANGKSGLIVLTVGLLMTLFILFDRDFDARHPREESLFHVSDMDQGESFWVSLEGQPESWSGEFLGENAEASNLTRIMPGYDEDVRILKDGEPMVEAATLKVLSDRLVDGQRELSLHLQSPSEAEYINLLLPQDLGFSSALVNGFEIKVPPAMSVNILKTDRADADKNLDKVSGTDWWRWRWYGLPKEGADIVLKLKPDKALKVKIVEVDYGMPESVPRRPAEIMARKYTWSDSRVIYQTWELDRTN